MPGPARSIVLALALAASSSGAAVAAGPPELPSAAAPDSVASFPCPRDPVSTVEIEACAGRQLLSLDRTFDAQAAALWSLLDASGRAEFTRANHAWLAYRSSECEAGARAYLGGSAAGIEYGTCENELTAARDHELEGLVALYCQGTTPVGRYRLCPRAPAADGTH